MQEIKVVLIGAGSIIFGPRTIGDLLISDKMNGVALEICLMDIAPEALRVSENYAHEACRIAGRSPKITATTNLEDALVNADFVVTAIEVDRYQHWAEDYHIPKKYGCVQIYGENGGIGGIFHTLRNIPPMLKIAKTMERICPDAWLINYTNPEAKLVEAIARLSSIKVVGLCHGFDAGLDQLEQMLEMPKSNIEFVAYGLNHFGWFTKIIDKTTGEDLYPRLRENESKANWLSDWDDLAFVRMMFRTYGLWPYPGTNHIGEYVHWSKDFIASDKLQFFFDPVRERPWKTMKTPVFVYSLTANPTAFALFGNEDVKTVYPDFESCFLIGEDGLHPSGEKAVAIMEAIAFDCETEIPSVNMMNHGSIPGLPKDMVVEVPATVNGAGIHPHRMEALPCAITAMIQQQGAIARLIVEAYSENSKNKVLQAMLLDSSTCGYAGAVETIDEMVALQKDLLPEMEWKQ